MVMSTAEVYKPQDDPHHVYLETDPLGDSNSLFDPTYSVSKIAQEAVARSCARAMDLPIVIPRMNASYGSNGGLLAYHLDFIRAGKPVTVRWDPACYSPIHQDDINGQTEAMLAAASVPATIVNWAGDEPVSIQEWCAYLRRAHWDRAEDREDQRSGSNPRDRGLIGPADADHWAVPGDLARRAATPGGGAGTDRRRPGREARQLRIVARSTRSPTPPTSERRWAVGADG